MNLTSEVSFLFNFCTNLKNLKSTKLDSLLSFVNDHLSAMKFLSIIYSILVVFAFFSSAFAEDLEDDAESGEVNVVSK